jgi:hypothetical protein
VKELIVLLFCLLVFAVQDACAVDMTLVWDPPTTNADGTPLTDLAGYKIYYGLASGSYATIIPVGNVLTYTVRNLLANVIYYFVATALDTSGNESAYSNEVSKSKAQSIGVPGATIAI